MTRLTSNDAPAAVRRALSDCGLPDDRWTAAEAVLAALKDLAKDPTRQLLPEHHSLHLPGWPWPEFLRNSGMSTVEVAQWKDAFLSGWSTALALLLGIDGGHVLDEVLGDA